MAKNFNKFVPDSDNFVQLLQNSFPSFDQMYEDEKYNFYKDNKKNFGDAFDLHEDFLILLVDTFNVCVGNNHLKQMTLTLICRYYSERAEFVRNISKMQVIFNQDEWNFYKWSNITIDEFTR